MEAGMTNYITYFSVCITDVARPTLLDVLMEVGAKKLVALDGAYIYKVEGEQNCIWIERSIRSIVGADDYLRFDSLPPSFQRCEVFDVTR
jgi:hypothetical protein